MQGSPMVHVDRLKPDGIPSLLFRPKGAGIPLPTVIYYHGWHSDKEQSSFKATVLACYGYQVLVPDAWHHGERDPVRHDDPGMLEEHLWSIIIRSAEESSALIRELGRDRGTDASRIGVMGSSMGGFSAAGALIANPEIKCLISFNGSCAWEHADTIFRKQSGRAQASGKELSRISRWDPMAHRDRLGLRPILLLHGDRDSQVSIESQREFMCAAAPLYRTHPERLQLVEIPRMDHYISTGMFETAIEWLQKYL